MDLLEIRQRIDSGDNSDDIRAYLGEKIMECLIAKGENLGPWERVHFGVAIELLPSPWLRLTWTHVDAVCNPPEWDPRRSVPRVVAHPPSIDELVEKLKSAMSKIRDQQVQGPQQT